MARTGLTAEQRRTKKNAYIRDRRARKEVEQEPRASKTRTTTLEIDEAKFAEARRALGTRTLRETVDRSFDEVLARVARERVIEQLRTMDGLDLDKPEVMSKAWR